MKDVKAVACRAMKPDEVFSVLLAIQDQLCKGDSADPKTRLGWHTTIQQWRASHYDDGLMFWWHYADFLNGVFELAVERKEWRSILKSNRNHTLYDLCEFVAARARMPAIQPLIVLGKPCLAAGVFCALRDLLASAGADITDFRPSTPLDRYARRGLPALYWALVRLSPGLMRRLVSKSPGEFLLLLIGGVLFLTTIFSLVFFLKTHAWAFATLACSTFMALFAVWWVSNVNCRVHCEGLNDFRALAREIARDVAWCARGSGEDTNRV